MTRHHDAEQITSFTWTTGLDINATAPFRPVGVAFKPSHFLPSDITFGGSTYWQTVRSRSSVSGIRMETTEGERHPHVTASVHGTSRLALPMSRVWIASRQRHMNRCKEPRDE